MSQDAERSLTEAWEREAARWIAWARAPGAKARVSYQGRIAGS